MKNRMFTSIMAAARLAAVCALGAALFGCGSDSKSDNSISGGVSIDGGIIAMENWEVAGVSQKGPFVKGATVTIQELDGKTMGQTGKSFKGDIKSDKGDFAIKKIDLVSQFAMLEASGYYRDEISGKKSSGPVTLRAITDLSNRKTVNINLLTHLEYDRVMNLVEDGDLSIAKAKAQAEKEIFEAFGIEGEFVESEDLDISKSGDGNAALLAISVLMQSDVDVAGLTERLAGFANAFAENGAWEDAETRAAIADWASAADASGKFSEIRKNVEGWKLGEEVPEFEKYVRKFWWENYNLGECDKKREGEIGKVKNEKSKNYYEKSNVRYICTDGNWQMASGLEMDTEGWAAGDIGEIKAGDVNGDALYIYDGKKWREASDVEILVGDICLESKEGEIKKDYVCKKETWTEATDYDYDIEGVECVEGETVVGKKSLLQYVCKKGEFAESAKLGTWFGGNGSSSIHQTYVPETSAWIYSTDDINGLNSTVKWPEGVKFETANDLPDAIMESCNGICGEVAFDESDNDELEHFVLMGFFFGKGEKQEVDATELGGLCIAYSASDKVTLEMDYDLAHAAQVDYAYPVYELPASSEVRVERVSWSSFTAPSWFEGDVDDYGVNSAKTFSGLKVKFVKDESSSMTFNIKAIGPYDGNCEDYAKFENE